MDVSLPEKLVILLGKYFYHDFLSLHDALGSQTCNYISISNYGITLHFNNFRIVCHFMTEHFSLCLPLTYLKLMEQVFSIPFLIHR